MPPAKTRMPISMRAAKLAHDEPMTRYRAGLILGVKIERVIEAWEQMYPNEKRILM